MSGETQQKVNAALGAINFFTNSLNIINTEMILVPSNGALAKEFQQEREKAHREFADRIIELANDMGDYFDGLDCFEDNQLDFINPIMDYINETEG